MKYLSFTLSTLFLSLALAHSDFESSSPSDGALLDTAPTEITLNFKNDIQPMFSIFKVYAIPAEFLEHDDTHTEGHSTGDDHAEGDDHSEENAEDDHHDSTTSHESDAHSAMDTAAKAFIPTVIDLQGDEEARSDAGLVTTETLSKSVTITLKENLAPGAYVVMFRALSADTHTIEGHITFEIKSQ